MAGTKETAIDVFLLSASSIYDEGQRRGAADVDTYHHRHRHSVHVSPMRSVMDNK